MDRVLALVLGYLLGSISPAYFIGRLLRHVDIRNLGLGLTGTADAFRVLGLGPGLVAAAFNLSKGLLAMLVAYLMHLPPVFVFASGAAAAVGHLLPFYLRFRGGQGVSVCAALVGVNLFFLVQDQPFPLHMNILLIATAAVTLLITRQPAMLGITAVPLLGYLVCRFLTPSPLFWYTLALLAAIVLASVLSIRRQGLMARTRAARRKIKLWRFLIRPAAMAFPVLLFLVGRTFTLVLLGAVTAVFLAMDLTRLTAGRVNLFLLRRARSTFKHEERTRLSSMTGFLLASLFVMLVFDPVIVFYAMTFLVFGDFAAKYFGLQYGQIKVFGKTLEGSAAHLLVCAAVALIVQQYLPMRLEVLLIGASVATLFEMLPVGVDDNVTVGISAAVALHLARNVIH